MNKPKSRPSKTPHRPATTNESGGSGKPSRMSDYIGRELRSMFDEVVAEPVPERFQELLEQLEKKQTKD